MKITLEVPETILAEIDIPRLRVNLISPQN
jgi:hypothetical protein